MMESDSGFEIRASGLPPGYKGKEVVRVEAPSPSSPEKPELEGAEKGPSGGNEGAEARQDGDDAAFEMTDSGNESEMESSSWDDSDDSDDYDDESPDLTDESSDEDDYDDSDEDDEYEDSSEEDTEEGEGSTLAVDDGVTDSVGGRMSKQAKFHKRHQSDDIGTTDSSSLPTDYSDEESSRQGTVGGSSVPGSSLKSGENEPKVPGPSSEHASSIELKPLSQGPPAPYLRSTKQRAQSAPVLIMRHRPSVWRHRRKTSDSEESVMQAHLPAAERDHPLLAQTGTFDFVNFKIEVSKVEKAFQKGHFFPHLWFRIKLRYGDLPYDWTIRRSHAEIQIFYAKLKKAYRKNPEIVVPFPGPSRHLLIHHRNTPKDIQVFLQKLCQLNHSVEGKVILCHFFGCSVVSFLPGYGEKPKEGFVWKLGGGRKNSGRKAHFKKTPPLFHKKWLVVGGSFVAYFNGVDSVIPREVLLCDRQFNISFMQKRFRHGAMIENGTRRLFVTSPKHVEDFQSKLQSLVENSEWHQPHRFGSFAPIRYQVPVDFLIDGDAYFDSLATALEAAQISIYVAAWWLSPELYLRRPPEENEAVRMDALLKRKAEEGVRIYILLYKEMTPFLPYDSAYTKEALRELHENISVVRHPNHILSGSLKWVHHEKLVVIDQKVAFIGGLDLCFGRYDTPQHLIADPEAAIWPGKDYYNCLFQDVKELDRPFDDMIDRTSVPRLPWHDVALKVQGQVARDAARHFIQRWNWCKTDKKIRTARIPFLVPKANFVVPSSEGEKDKGGLYDIAPVGTHVAQVVRSSSQWSAGIPTEASICSAFLSLVNDSKHYVYIENQFFITNSSAKVKEVQNTVGMAICNRIKRAHQAGQKFHVFIVLPLKPGFEGKITTTDSIPLRRVMEYQYKCIVKDDGDSLFELLEKEGIDPTQYISIHGLRNYSIISDKYVTEEVYVHSKLVIVDDKFAMIGSGNLNDRSLLGDRDSEIAVVVTDTLNVETKMNGETYYANRSIFELRCRLFEEHLGLKPSRVATHSNLGHQHQFVQDPISEEFLNFWLETSRKNTKIFRDVFHPIPDDTVTTLSEFNEYKAAANPPFTTQKELLSGVKGFLTDFPLQFFSNESLSEAPALNPDALVPVDIFL